MLKNILKLDGIQKLSKDAQESISGGRKTLSCDGRPPGSFCYVNGCPGICNSGGHCNMY